MDRRKFLQAVGVGAAAAVVAPKAIAGAAVPETFTTEVFRTHFPHQGKYFFGIDQVRFVLYRHDGGKITEVHLLSGGSGYGASGGAFSPGEAISLGVRADRSNA